MPVRSRIEPESGTLLVRLALPDRPGGLATVAGVFAAHGVDILRLDVVERSDGVAIDDLLVSGGDIAGALADLEPEIRVLGSPAVTSMPDVAVAMAHACAAVTSTRSLGGMRRALLAAAIRVAGGDEGVVLRDAGHGWLRPVAATVDARLTPIRSREPALAREALREARPLQTDGGAAWCPDAYRAAFPAGPVLCLPVGEPPSLAVTIVRVEPPRFAAGEVERAAALVGVAAGALAALGERATSSSSGAPLVAEARP